MKNTTKDTTYALITLGNGYKIKEEYNIALIYYRNAINNAKRFDQRNELVSCYIECFDINDISNNMYSFEIGEVLSLLEKKIDIDVRYNLFLVLCKYLLKANQLELLNEIINQEKIRMVKYEKK